MSDVFKALGHPARRRILKLLQARPHASGELAAAFDMAWPTLTGHLNVLKGAGLVTAEREGASIIYRLNVSVGEEAAAFLMDLFGAGERRDAKETKP